MLGLQLTLASKIGIIANFDSSVTKIRGISLANTKQAVKRTRQAEKSRMSNKWQITRMSTHVKKVRTAIESKDLEAAKSAYISATSLIDSLAHKGLIHKNKAARLKSRLNKGIALLAKAA